MTHLESINKKGPGVVTAADIQHDDRVSLPDLNHPIATLTKAGELKMTAKVTLV